MLGWGRKFESFMILDARFVHGCKCKTFKNITFWIYIALGRPNDQKSIRRNAAIHCVSCALWKNLKTFNERRVLRAGFFNIYTLLLLERWRSLKILITVMLINKCSRILKFKVSYFSGGPTLTAKGTDSMLWFANKYCSDPQNKSSK